jgi:hypothetical protein
MAQAIKLASQKTVILPPNRFLEDSTLLPTWINGERGKI